MGRSERAKSVVNKQPDIEGQIEKLAAIEHERWADWQRWCNSEIRANANDIESPLRRWDKQIETPYEQLSEREKDSDREQVRRYLPIIKDLIAQREQQARLKALEWVYSYLPRGDEFKNAKKSDLQEIIMALDTDVAWEIAEIKELEQNKESRRQ